MNRSILSDAVRDMVSARGYSFHTSTQESLPTSVADYPTAFLPYPQFQSIEGGSRGRITYSLTLYLLASGAKLPPAARLAQTDALEDDALAIFAELSRHERVLYIDELKMTPSVMKLTTRGDISLTVTASVTCLSDNQ